MKYYNLPTSQQIADYHSGQLSMENNQWIEKLMSSNLFVKSAVEDFPLDQQHEVQTISERISGKITKSYLQKRGFWSRFGGWISLSIILLLIGVLAVLNMSPEQKYTQKGLLLAENQEKGEKPILEESEKLSSNRKEVIAQKSPETNEQKEVLNSNTVQSENNTDNGQKTADPMLEMEDAASVTTNTEAEVESKEQTKLTGKLLKSVRSVNLISKDFNTEYKRYIPEYPGGDRALFDYFRTQLKPVELDYSEGAFDAAVTFNLSVDKNGMDTSYEIEGALHPVHKIQLENCFKNLPRFKPGQTDVTYTVEIAFN